MAYTGGTTQVAPRLMEKHLTWLQSHCDNVNKAINSALTQYLRKEQFDRITAREKEYLYGKTLWLTGFSWQERKKKSVRLMRQHLDYMKLNGIVVGRCLDLAIEEYIKSGGDEARRNNDTTIEEGAR